MKQRYWLSFWTSDVGCLHRAAFPCWLTGHRNWGQSSSICGWVLATSDADAWKQVQNDFEIEERGFCYATPPDWEPNLHRYPVCLEGETKETS